MRLRDVGFTIGFVTLDGGEHPAIRDERDGSIKIFDEHTGKSREHLLCILNRMSWDHASYQRPFDPEIWAAKIYGEADDGCRE